MSANYERKNATHRKSRFSFQTLSIVVKTGTRRCSPHSPPKAWSTFNVGKGMLSRNQNVIHISKILANYKEIYPASRRDLKTPYTKKRGSGSRFTKQHQVGDKVSHTILAPFSELNGRKPVFVTSGIHFVVCQLCCAVARSYAGISKQSITQNHPQPPIKSHNSFVRYHNRQPLSRPRIAKTKS